MGDSLNIVGLAVSCCALLSKVFVVSNERSEAQLLRF